MGRSRSTPARNADSWSPESWATIGNEEREPTRPGVARGLDRTEDDPQDHRRSSRSGVPSAPRRVVGLERRTCLRRARSTGLLSRLRSSGQDDRRPIRCTHDGRVDCPHRRRVVVVITSVGAADTRTSAKIMMSVVPRILAAVKSVHGGISVRWRLRKPCPPRPRTVADHRRRGGGAARAPSPAPAVTGQGWASTVGVLPTPPLSSARQPPSPAASRKPIQAERVGLIGAQLADESAPGRRPVGPRDLPGAADDVVGPAVAVDDDAPGQPPSLERGGSGGGISAPVRLLPSAALSAPALWRPPTRCRRGPPPHHRLAGVQQRPRLRGEDGVMSSAVSSSSSEPPLLQLTLLSWWATRPWNRRDPPRCREREATRPPPHGGERNAGRCTV